VGVVLRNQSVAARLARWHRASTLPQAAPYTWPESDLAGSDATGSAADLEAIRLAASA
jgi:hypothetical protein